MGDSTTAPFSNGDGGGASSGSVGRQAPVAQSVVGPDMMFKISKKIAQLTKVIYSLNTRNDDLELELESLRSSYEERLAEAVAGMKVGRGEADGAEHASGGGANGVVGEAANGGG
jgi:hypothetical protein